MISVQIHVSVDGRSFGCDVDEPTVRGFNNTTEAILLLTKEVERIVAAIDASEEIRTRSQ